MQKHAELRGASTSADRLWLRQRQDYMPASLLALLAKAWSSGGFVGDTRGAAAPACEQSRDKQSRSGSNESRNATGCCPATQFTTHVRVVVVASSGQTITGSGCTTGLVVVTGVHCWRGERPNGHSGFGTPTCADGPPCETGLQLMANSKTAAALLVRSGATVRA